MYSVAISTTRNVDTTSGTTITGLDCAVRARSSGGRGGRCQAAGSPRRRQRYSTSGGGCRAGIAVALSWPSPHRGAWRSGHRGMALSARSSARSPGPDQHQQAVGSARSFARSSILGPGRGSAPGAGVQLGQQVGERTGGGLVAVALAWRGVRLGTGSGGGFVVAGSVVRVRGQLTRGG